MTATANGKATIAKRRATSRGFLSIENPLRGFRNGSLCRGCKRKTVNKRSPSRPLSHRDDNDNDKVPASKTQRQSSQPAHGLGHQGVFGCFVVGQVRYREAQVR